MELSFSSLPKKFINFAILLMATVTVSADLWAQPSIEEYGALPTIQNMAISPNGELVAFRKVANGQDIVQVVSLNENKLVTAIDVSSVKVRHIFFVNNEQIMLRAAEHRRVQKDFGKFDVSTIYSLDLASGNLRQLLVPGDGVVYPGQTGLGRIVGISPDGKYAFMPAYYGERTLVMGRYANPSYSLLRVSIAGIGKPMRVKAGSYETEDYFVDDDGETIAMEEFDDAEKVHRVVALQGGDWVEIFRRETNFKNLGFMGLTPDKENLVVIDTNEQTGRSAYFTMSLSDGQMQGPMYARDDADVVGVIMDMQRVVQGVMYSGLLPAYRFFDKSLDKRVKDIQSLFPDHAVSIVDRSADWKHILVLMEGTQSSGEYYLFSEGQAPKFVASQRPAIPSDQVNPIGTVTFTARDGFKIPTIITIPRDRVVEMKNLPAIVMPHGGPTSYDAVGFNYLAQALASEGYMVIMPQFRGSSGFGTAHQVAGYGEWGRKMQDDITDAVSFFADRGMIDSDRVCIVGGSYGGYAALAGGAFTPDLYKCAVSINGIGDLQDFRDWVRSERGRNSEVLAYWETQIGRDDYSTEEARARSPEYSVDQFVSPVLLIHSKSDEIVPFSQSEQMRRALERADKEVQLVELEGDDHYLSFGETRLQALKATVEFVRENLSADQ